MTLYAQNLMTYVTFRNEATVIEFAATIWIQLKFCFNNKIVYRSINNKITIANKIGHFTVP